MRPHPPELLLEPYVGIDYFVPSPELEEWVRKTFLDDSSPLFNEEHIHLRRADLRFLWTNVPNVKKMRVIAGEAERPMFRGGAWQKHRQEMQFQEWFGGMPDFVITLDAGFASQADDSSFCALVEHELYHCAQAVDEFGAPKFRQDSDLPVFAMRGHDVEEFIGVVRRYGMTENVREFVAAALSEEGKIETGDIRFMCGSCSR